MNERGDEANVPREPWQRLLEDPADGPPETTDARIRAAARRAVAPRGQRWWIPASLAASVVLAVLIVRTEIGTDGRIPIAPAERGEDAAIDSRIIDRREGEQAREPKAVPAAPSPVLSKQRDEAEPDAYGTAEPGLGEVAANTAPLVGGPERELAAASEMPAERTQLETAAPSSDERANQTPAAPRPSALPEPEAWYAAIEKLRREGRTAEADRELERLKNAYPGWLENRLRREVPP